ncbi:MAG: NUDIX domain-containing protein [archaeon]
MRNYPILAVVGVVEYQGKFLLIERCSDDEHYSNTWAFPGGRVEIGETVVEALRREIEEETNLELIDEAAFLNTFKFEDKVGLAFLLRAKSDKVKVCEDITNYKWVESVEEMQKLKIIPGICNHLVDAQKAMKNLTSLEDMNLIYSKFINK